MSSWKKASKTNQQVHRERHQPESRQHLGLLEKKKDYKVRGEHVHNKERTLKILHKKALDKNPDEFYHHMINSRIKNGEHHEITKPDEHTPEQIALMQTRDVKYIAMKRTMEARKIERLQAQLPVIDAADGVKNKHIFFVDDEKETKDFSVAAKLGTHPALLSRKANRPRLEDLHKLQLPELDETILSAMVKSKEATYKELQKRIDREKDLSIIQHKLEIKRALKQKRLLKPKKIKDGTKNTAPVYRFPYERKK